MKGLAEQFAKSIGLEAEPQRATRYDLNAALIWIRVEARDDVYPVYVDPEAARSIGRRDMAADVEQEHYTEIHPGDHVTTHLVTVSTSPFKQDVRSPTPPRSTDARPFVHDAAHLVGPHLRRHARPHLRRHPRRVAYHRHRLRVGHPPQPPSGYRFQTRCPRATEVCAARRPQLIDIAPGLQVAYHHPLEENR